MAKRIVTVGLEESVVKRVDDLAAAQGMSRSAYVERAVVESLVDDELTVKALTDPVVGGALLKAFGDPSVLRKMVEVMRADVSDEQLSLFVQGMESVSKKATKNAKPSKRKKRGR